MTEKLFKWFMFSALAGLIFPGIRAAKLVFGDHEISVVALFGAGELLPIGACTGIAAMVDLVSSNVVWKYVRYMAAFWCLVSIAVGAATHGYIDGLKEAGKAWNASDVAYASVTNYVVTLFAAMLCVAVAEKGKLPAS